MKMWITSQNHEEFPAFLEAKDASLTSYPDKCSAVRGDVYAGR